jgi:hypothetical protein
MTQPTDFSISSDRFHIIAPMAYFSCSQETEKFMQSFSLTARLKLSDRRPGLTIDTFGLWLRPLSGCASVLAAQQAILSYW